MTPIILNQINQIRNLNIAPMYDIAAVWQIAHDHQMTELADYIEKEEVKYFYYINHNEEPAVTYPMSDERIISVANLYGENARDLIQYVRKVEADGKLVDEGFLINHIREVTHYWERVCIKKFLKVAAEKESTS